MDLRVFNHSTPAYFGFTRFKLRFNQRAYELACFKVSGDLWYDHTYGNKRNVHGNQGNLFQEIVRLPGIGFFHYGDSSVLSQPIIDLAVADVNCINMSGSALENTIGETASRSADIKYSKPIYVYFKLV